MQSAEITRTGEQNERAFGFENHPDAEQDVPVIVQVHDDVQVHLQKGALHPFLLISSRGVRQGSGPSGTLPCCSRSAGVGASIEVVAAAAGDGPEWASLVVE